jgi:arylsulfotransferase ASST
MGWSLFRKAGLTFHSPAQSFKGYTLVAPIAADFAVLLDMDGRVVHRWVISGFRIFHARLLPTGKLLALCADASLPPAPQVPFDQPPPPFAEHIRRLGGAATHLKEIDHDANLTWEYANSTLHHDFVRLPNGNTVVAEWVELPEQLATKVKGGARRPREKFPRMLCDDILEIDPSGSELRRVHLYELLDPVRDAICPLETRWEWTHLNSLDTFPGGDILFSCRSNSRVGIITPEGRLSWKYGAPDVVHQHHATALANGNVQIFDNGMHRIGMPYSRVVEVEPARRKVAWEYSGEPPEQFFSGHISGAERQPNGNVLICEGASGRVFEVTRRGETVWEWVTPFSTNNQGRVRAWIFRVYRYAPDFPGLRGLALDPQKYADLNRLYGLTTLSS